MQKNAASAARLHLLWPCWCLALLSGCAPLEWHKAEVTAAVRDHDAAECMAQARTEALQRIPAFRPPGPRVTIDNRGRAVSSYPTRYDDERFMLEQEVMRECMRERGYALREVEPRKP